MLYLKKSHKERSFWIVFFVLMAAVVVVFGERVHLWHFTEVTDGQAIALSEQYRMGSVYDRQGELIVTGGESPGSMNWQVAQPFQPAFTNLIGEDISETMNSKMTVLGCCPWLFGSEDERLSLECFLQPGKDRVGGNVWLTIDRGLQEYIYELLQTADSNSAAVVVSNYTTGEILAAVSTPSFSPGETVSRDENGIINDARAFSQTVSRRFHPGSTIKPILAAIALDIDPGLENFQYNCCEENHIFHTKDGEIKIHCSGNSLHGLVGMSEAMACSCNGYFIALLQQLPREKLEEKLEEWGFDTVTEYSFFFWDAAFFGNAKLKGQDELFSAIGQGNAYITPVQMNAFTNAILNGGSYKEPTIILGKSSDNGESIQESLLENREFSVCGRGSAEKVKEMMLEVTVSGTGTEFYLPGFAAKTGTAENEDGSATIWTTGGLTDYLTPYSVTVCLDCTDQASPYAGKIAQRILMYMQEEKQ